MQIGSGLVIYAIGGKGALLVVIVIFALIVWALWNAAGRITRPPK